MFSSYSKSFHHYWLIDTIGFKGRLGPLGSMSYTNIIYSFFRSLRPYIETMVLIGASLEYPNGENQILPVKNNMVQQATTLYYVADN